MGTFPTLATRPAGCVYTTQLSDPYLTPQSLPRAESGLALGATTSTVPQSKTLRSQDPRHQPQLTFTQPAWDTKDFTCPSQQQPKQGKRRH